QGVSGSGGRDPRGEGDEGEQQGEAKGFAHRHSPFFEHKQKENVPAPPFPSPERLPQARKDLEEASGSAQKQSQVRLSASQIQTPLPPPPPHVHDQPSLGAKQARPLMLLYAGRA